MEMSIVSVWLVVAEVPASEDASASCYELAKHIRVLAMIVTELKLREVQRKILRADIVVCPDHTTLEQRPERFHVVGVHVAANILASAMADGFVWEPYRVQMRVTTMLVRSHQINRATDGLTDETVKRNCVGILDHLASDVALPADGSDNANLARTDSTRYVALLVPVAILVLATNERFVDFNHAHQFLKVVILHRGANPMAHIPRGLFLLESHNPLNVQGANALLRIQHQ